MAAGNAEDGGRLWNARFVHLVAIEVALQMGLQLSTPIVSNYAVSLGMTVALAGVLAGLIATTSVFMRPISGFVSDRFSKKSLMVGAAAAMAVAVLGCAFSTSAFAIGFFRVVLGIAFAFKSVVSISMVRLVVPASAVGRGVGWFSLAFTVACAVAPAIGAEVGAAVGYRASFLLAGVLLAAGFVLALLFKAPDSAQAHAAPATGARGLRALAQFLRPSRLFFAPFVSPCCSHGVSHDGAKRRERPTLDRVFMRGIGGASAFFAAYAAACLVSRPLAGRVSDKRGLAALLVPMSFVSIAGMLAMAFVPSLWGVVLGGLLTGTGQASSYSALQAEAVRGVPEEKVGRAVSTFYIGPDLGTGLGPVLGGAVLQAWGPTALYLFGAGSFAACLALFLALRAWRAARRAGAR